MPRLTQLALLRSQVLPDYPNGLQDWSCSAFPDDDKPVDSLIVGLISIASASRARSSSSSSSSGAVAHRAF
jgi:hypothetical protein